MTVPFAYFAQVDVSDNTFSDAFERDDVDMFSFELKHEEGSKPTFTLQVMNPQHGLLRSGAHLYGWFSYDTRSTAGVVPLLFGRLLGVPTNITGEKVMLVYVADPPDYLAQKQQVAEKKKVRPYYDPIFLDAAHRDDPDSILEAWSSRFHVDRVSNVVSTSDISWGEDGTVTFSQSDVFYKSFDMRIGQSPLTTIEIEGTVGWNQHAFGTIDFGSETFSSYSGDGILRDWPKPAAQLGGGWYVESSTCVDAANVTHAVTASWTSSWRNTAKVHAVGDAMSISESFSVPAVPGATQSVVLKSQNGVLDPYAVDEDGDPDPLNIPMSVQTATATAALWTIPTTLTLGYESNRPRTEKVRFTINADLQPLLTYVDASTNSETITKSGINVDASILNVENWLSVVGQAVTFGQVIFVPQQLISPFEIPSFQAVLIEGTNGSTEPVFSPNIGDLTVSGSVTYVSLGSTLPSDFPDWPANTIITAGYLTRPKRRFSTVWDQLLQPFPLPLVGASVGLDQIIQSNDGQTFFQVTTSGVTGLVEPSWNRTIGATTTSAGVTFTTIGHELPDGTTFWMAVNPSPGTTAPEVLPAFGSSAAGTEIVDGGVTWKSIGTGGSFVGVPIKDVTRRSYFPSERGLWSLEYLISLARAHILMRARAVTIFWECPPEKVFGLSCRMNARIFDYRIPGGNAVGKITSYGLRLDGQSGRFVGFVTIGCTIGHGVNVATNEGTDFFDDRDTSGEGFDVDGFDDIEGLVVAVPSGDIGYTPPSDSPADDGLVFPLTANQAVLVNQTHASDQTGAVGTGLKTALEQAVIQARPVTGPAQSIANQMLAMRLGAQNLGAELQGSPVWKEIQLKPLTGNSFNTEIVISTTVLSAPKMIDLEAA
jgi:hypothetical protein